MYYIFLLSDAKIGFLFFRMGGAVSSGENNDALVDNLIRANYIKSPDVERVFRAVDRAFYYTDDEKSLAYKDLAWKSQNLHLSAPWLILEIFVSSFHFF